MTVREEITFDDYKTYGPGIGLVCNELVNMGVKESELEDLSKLSPISSYRPGSKEYDRDCDLNDMKTLIGGAICGLLGAAVIDVTFELNGITSGLVYLLGGFGGAAIYHCEGEHGDYWDDEPSQGQDSSEYEMFLELRKKYPNKVEEIIQRHYKEFK